MRFALANEIGAENESKKKKKISKAKLILLYLGI